MLRHSVHLTVIGAAPVLLQACSKPKLECEDASGLSEADTSLRSSLEYRDDSPHGDAKNCLNCAFYVAAGKNQCGQCTLVKGPIHPAGYCNSWAAKG